MNQLWQSGLPPFDGDTLFTDDPISVQDLQAILAPGQDWGRASRQLGPAVAIPVELNHHELPACQIPIASRPLEPPLWVHIQLLTLS
jgi:hypothetical protein